MSSNSSKNLYKVGDYVYFETAASLPYQIRRIEELLQTGNTVEARVTIIHRRSDLTNNLIGILDKEQINCEKNADELEHSVKKSGGESGDVEISSNNFTGSGENCLDAPDASSQEVVKNKSENGLEVQDRRYHLLTKEQQHHVKLCEVFPSKIQEVLLATHIRGKCYVVPFIDGVDQRANFLDNDSVFYHIRKYDPDKKTLKLAERYIRVGPRYQAKVPDYDADLEDKENCDYREKLRFLPSKLSDSTLDNLLQHSFAVGAYARCLDHVFLSRTGISCSLAASLSSRGVTKQTAYDILHKCNYEKECFLAELVKDGKALLCRDELEDFSPGEVAAFQKAYEIVGTDFQKIREVLPHKSVSTLISYYYLWRTTAQYVQSRQQKPKTERLKQLYIPVYNKIHPSVVWKDHPNRPPKPCASCVSTVSTNWYSWGVRGRDATKLCDQCWMYWKKYGSLRCDKFIDSMANENGTGGDEDVDETDKTASAINPSSSTIEQPENFSKSSATIAFNSATPSQVPSSVKEDRHPCPQAGCSLIFTNVQALSRHGMNVHKWSHPIQQTSGDYNTVSSNKNVITSQNGLTSGRQPQSLAAEAVLSSGSNGILKSRQQQHQHHHKRPSGTNVPSNTATTLLSGVCQNIPTQFYFRSSSDIRVGRLMYAKMSYPQLTRRPNKVSIDYGSLGDIISLGSELVKEAPALYQSINKTTVKSKSIVNVVDRLRAAAQSNNLKRRLEGDSVLETPAAKRVVPTS